jgi:hypothetical protein
MVDLNLSLSINGWSFYQSFNNSNFKKNLNTAAHGGKEYIQSWVTALPQRHADAERYATNAAGHGAWDLTPWPLTLQLRAHSWRHLSLTSWAMAPDVYFC